MSFPRTTAGAVPIITRTEYTHDSSTITSSPFYASFSMVREGLIRRIRAMGTKNDGTPRGVPLPFELSLYEKNPEGSDGTDGVHRIATYRVHSKNETVFPGTNDWVLDSEEEMYYQLTGLSKTSRVGTLYVSIKGIGSGGINKFVLVLDVQEAGGAS